MKKANHNADVSLKSLVLSFGNIKYSSNKSLQLSNIY